MAGTTQDAALFGQKREEVTRSDEIARLAFRVDRFEDCHRPFTGCDSGPTTTVIDWHGKAGPQRAVAMVDHRRQIESLAIVG